MYTLAYSFNADPGLAVTPQLLRTSGDPVSGALVLSSFTAGEWYAFTMSIPSDFRGFLSFWDGTTTYAMFAVNPQEAEYLDVRVSQAGTGTGAKATQITVRTTAGRPVAGASVWITSDAAGQFLVAGTLQTDDFGTVTFALDPGIYYAWRSHPSVQFVNPQALEV
jgi:hypothetical protein